MKPVTFEDAVRLLGAGDSRLLTILDQLASGAIIGAAMITGGASLALIEAKNEAVKHGHDLVRRGIQRYMAKQGLHQTDLLVAAHSVLVIVAFVEALDDLIESSR